MVIVASRDSLLAVIVFMHRYQSALSSLSKVLIIMSVIALVAVGNSSSGSIPYVRLQAVAIDIVFFCFWAIANAKRNTITLCACRINSHILPQLRLCHIDHYRLDIPLVLRVKTTPTR